MSFDSTASIVRILRPDDSIAGTGFVVSSDGLIATCAHVVTAAGAKPSDRLRVIFNAGNAQHIAEVLGGDLWREQEDAAVLRLIESLPPGVVPVRLGRTSGTRGHACSTLGYPPVGTLAGLDGRGTIYRLRRDANSRQLLQLASTEITTGFSGAPLFDEETQRVVGMITEIAKPDQYGRLGETAFATPSEVLFEILQPHCSHLRLHPPQAIEDYLAAVRAYCANLPYLTLHDIRPPRTLDEVYVSLKARPQPRKDDAKPQEEQERFEREALWLQPLSIAEVMQSRDAPHVLILGEPGAGKSTLLRQMAEQAWDAPQAIGLSEPHLPLLVPLRQLVANDGSLEKRLSHALASEMSLAYDLPEGFLVQWPQQTGARWLILLDALDEVPDSERARLMQWLKGQLTYLREHRVVITSRPTGYKDDFDAKTFSHYDLLPSTADQASELARKWFSDKADAFLKELDRIRAGDLRGTPLLLTIAAKVFSERGTLPERRSGLYKQFVTIWLTEARQRDVKHELNERLWDVALFALAQLALAMTEQPEEVPEQALNRVAADYLRKELDYKIDEAEIHSRRLIQVLARRSGMFTQRGRTCQFAHPTFREFLVACAVVRGGSNDLELLWRHVISRWQQIGWREVSLFSLGILSDNGQEVTSLLEQVAKAGEREALLFVAAGLAENLKVSIDFANTVTDSLIALALRWTWFDVSFAYSIFQILGEMPAYSPMVGRLRSLMQDEEVDDLTRIWIAEALGRLGHVAEAVSAVLALVYKNQPSITVHRQAVAMLGRLKRGSELLRLISDENINFQVRIEAEEELDRLKRIDELLALALDEHLDIRLRKWALFYLGCSADSHVVPYLHRIGRMDNERSLRLEAWHAIKKIDGRMQDSGAM